MRRNTILLALVALLVAPPALNAAAQDSLQMYVEPVTDNARAIQGLFNTTLIIAMVVFIGVEALLFYVIWRFRNNKTVPAGETHRGHTKAEVAWTVIPALILLFLGVLSAGTLFTIDTIPEDPDVTVRVEASQFVWAFIYEDGSRTINELRVQEGTVVRLDITASDVLHAVWIPQFALKLDAVPGRINQAWFVAPEPGEYFLQCAEYCGVGHHAMHAKVTVFEAGSQARPFGKATAPATNSTT